MKKNVIFLICLISSIVVFGHNETKNSKADTETPPVFTGSEMAPAFMRTNNTLLFRDYLEKNVKYPDKAVQCGWEGTELISFTVTPDGKVSGFEVINSISKEIDKEIIRAVKETSGMWQPGTSEGVPVAKKQEISMVFSDLSKSKINKHFVERATYHYKEGSKQLITNQNPKKALKHFDKGTRYLPNDKGLLMLRGICNYELGNKDVAIKDWNRIVALGGAETEHQNLNKMKGFGEMSKILAYDMNN